MLEAEKALAAGPACSGPVEFSDVRLHHQVTRMLSEEEFMSVAKVYTHAVQGAPKMLGILKMMADGNPAYAAALKHADGAKLRPFAQYLYGKVLNDPNSQVCRGASQTAECTKYWQSAAEAGVVYALVGMGKLCRDSPSCDAADALKWYNQALELAAVPEAAYNAGVIYGLGHKEVAVDLERAERYYERCAKMELGSGSTARMLELLGPENEPQASYQPLARSNLLVVRRAIQTQGIRKPQSKARNWPRGLPELFPGPPGWLDEDMGAQLLLDKGMPKFMIDMVCGNFKHQRQMDDRHRHLCAVYADADGMDARHTMERHQELFRTAGWDFSAALAAFPDQPACRWKEANDLMMRAGGLALLEDGSYKPPDPPLPRRCGKCDAECVTECACGEPYCSKTCQAEDWKAHRSACEMVRDNNEPAVELTRQFWGPDGVVLE